MILVLVETEAGPESIQVSEVSLETLALARSLAAEGGGIKIRALVVGDVADREGLAAELGAHGVSEVHQAVGEAFLSFGGASWAAALQAARESTGSVVVVAGGSPRGGEVLAHLAARLDVPMAANVVSFSGLAPFVVSRQVVGGSALEEMLLDRRPAVLTVAGHSWTAARAETSTVATWHAFTPEVSDADLVARVVSTGQKEPDHSDSLKTARVVVGAGRGAGGPEGFAAVAELAELLHGSLGVSRVVTSLGWRPHHEQVGQTGSRISPEVYIPCGISGAIQHWAGCASSKTILAINTDPDAPMMTKATYAVVGDMHEVVPAVIQELRRRRG
ncbi:MAG: electron transfer flavoprotein subunit alpha/FixB family protein [Marmoricola sp.]